MFVKKLRTAQYACTRVVINQKNFRHYNWDQMRDTYTNFTYNNQTYVFNKCAQHTKDTREINIKIYLMNLHPDKDVLPLNI